MVIRAAQLLVRMARPEDAEIIRDLQVLSLKVLAAKDYSPPQMAALLCSKQSVRGWDELHFIAELGGMIVGVAALSRQGPWINALFVHPEFTRQGIARRLMEAVEEEAIRRGDRSLEVVASLTGEPFYTKVGFEFIGPTMIEIEGDSQTSIPCVRMRKLLWEAWRGETHPERPGYQDNTLGETAIHVIGMVLAAALLVGLGQLLALLFEL
ncbi:MAG: GNAT family N-acetyltransferase [Synechococcales cyanobacterium RM1_1_8]|nr:GNAT family N-acetyltransferase [Synechococcales cyanobacterium RM1_1_8]